MKKLLCVLLSLALCCVLLPGCEEKPPEKLRVCFDVGGGYDLTNSISTQEQDVRKFMSYLDDCDKYIREGINSQEIELEIIPSDETQTTERETALQRIRTEIMTGEGPDVFICNADSMGYLHQERLFPYVEKAIQDGMFLPLDDYIKRAVLTNFGDLCAPVLEGGKDKDGRQMVIPMTYTINLDIYHKEDLPSYDAAGKTWEDVLQGDDPILASQAGWMFDVSTWTEELEGAGEFYENHTPGFSHIFPGLIDFEKGELTMTEEEMTARIREAMVAYRDYLEQGTASEKISSELWPSTSVRISSEEVTMVPLRNERGGVTAEVTMYCAVNKNTKQPERAFEVIDALLSETPQQGSSLYKNRIGMPVNQNIFSPELPYDKPFHFVFTQQQYEEYQKAIGQIDAVIFPSMLDAQFWSWPESLFSDLQDEMLGSFDHGEDLFSSNPEIFLKGTISDERLSEIVHAYYQKMERLLDES